MSASQPSSHDLSVVIVSWNTRELLLQCLKSVYEEATASGLGVEAIVVDNASSDGSADAVREQFPEVTLLAMDENLGFAAANNLGIERSNGDAILILNPDTELCSGSLRALLATLHASSHVGMSAPVLLNSDFSFQSAGYRFPGLAQTMLDLYPLHPRLIASRFNGRYSAGDGLTPFQIDHPLGACMLVRRETIQDVGMFDPGFFIYSEEIDWCRRIHEAGWTILCGPAAKVVHHGGQSTGQLPDRMRSQLHRSRARYFQKHESAAFRRTLQRLMQTGIRLKQSGLPLPSDGRSADDLAAIAAIYADADSGPGNE